MTARFFSVDGTSLTKVAEAKTGRWDQGVVWSRDGKTLLVQSMVDNAISVLSFDGKIDDADQTAAPSPRSNNAIHNHEPSGDAQTRRQALPLEQKPRRER